MNRQEAIKKLATAFGHSEEETTKDVANMSDEAVVKMAQDADKLAAKFVADNASHFGKNFWLDTAEQAVIGFTAGAAVMGGIYLAAWAIGKMAGDGTGDGQ